MVESDFFKINMFGYKIPPILVSKVLKPTLEVYRNPWVRAELAETFTIDVTFHDLENGTRPPTSISLGPRVRGICVKWPLFSNFPDFSAPREIEVGASCHFQDCEKVLRLWKFQPIPPAPTDFCRLLRIPYHKSGGILYTYFLILQKIWKYFRGLPELMFMVPGGLTYLHSQAYDVSV